MTTQTLQPPKVGKTEKPERQSPNSRKYWGEMSNRTESYAKAETITG
ncbi:hypothetical protein [Mastigocladopsis repens]|nr:hypothetical protein [Mastigocladopsis repens]